VLGDDTGENGDLSELKGALDHANDDERVWEMKKSNSETHGSGILSACQTSSSLDTTDGNVNGRWARARKKRYRGRGRTRETTGVLESGERSVRKDERFAREPVGEFA
jgi:hypothetical protein